MKSRQADLLKSKHDHVKTGEQTNVLTKEKFERALRRASRKLPVPDKPREPDVEQALATAATQGPV